MHHWLPHSLAQCEYFLRQRILEQLDDSADENTQVNVGEEDDVIQHERGLDLDDDQDQFNFAREKTEYVYLRHQTMCRSQTGDCCVLPCPHCV